MLRMISIPVKRINSLGVNLFQNSLIKKILGRLFPNSIVTELSSKKNSFLITLQMVEL